MHRKISLMSDRIRQLEDALAVVQSTVTNEAHPLLDRELMKIKSSLELHSAVEETEKENLPKEEGEDGEETHYIDAFGTLAIRDDGAATFYGRSAGSEVRSNRSSVSKSRQKLTPFTGTSSQSLLIVSMLSSYDIASPSPDSDTNFLDFLRANYHPHRLSIALSGPSR